jgi:EAL domain-containing protein (putative c-di-GMP-specific phosphodiesterase class I)
LKLRFCSAIEELVKIIPIPGTSATRENIVHDIDNLLKQYEFPLNQIVCTVAERAAAVTGKRALWKNERKSSE